MNNVQVLKTPILAIILVVGAFFIGAVQNAIAKSMGYNFPAILLVFTQYSLCLVFYFPLLYKTKFKILYTKRPILMLFRAVAGVAYWWGLFYAVKFIPLVDASLLTNLAPIWVSLIGLVFLQIPIDKKLYSAIGVGFIGITMILKPNGGIFSIGSLIAILSGMFMASTLVAVKSLMKTEKSSSIIIYYYLIATIFALPFAIQHLVMPNLQQLLLLALNTVLMLLHQELLNRGFAKGSASHLSILTYIGVLFSAMLGWLLWAEVPNIFSIFGGVLICCSGIYILLRQSNSVVSVAKANMEKCNE